LAQNLTGGVNEHLNTTNIAEFQPIAQTSVFNQMIKKNSITKATSGATNIPSERVGDWICCNCHNVNY
jgi:hypothetical protein